MTVIESKLESEHNPPGEAQNEDNSALEPSAHDFYIRAMEIMDQSGIEYLVGGAYAFERYTGISRHTKDFDIFMRREDADGALKAFEEAGYKSEMTFPHWLGKAYNGDLFVDIIFSSGNGIAEVDDEWFENAAEGTVLGYPTRLCPAEEIIWSKSFVMERERYDGADVAHLFRASAEDLDWQRLLLRYGEYWRVLYSYLILFGFIYPAERNKIPAWVMGELGSRLAKELHSTPSDESVCQGTLISREQFLPDVQKWGYKDARQEPRGNMSRKDIKHWTNAIDEDK